MSLPNPGMNFTPFDPLPASDLNDMVENIESLADGSGLDDISYSTTDISNPYKFSAYCSTGKAIVNQTLIIDFQTEIFDTNNNFASSRYTAPVAGFYWIYSQVWFGNAGAITTEWAEAHIYKNGVINLSSDRMNGSGDSNRLIRVKVGGLIQLAAGDYIEVFGAFVGSRDIVAGSNSTYVMGFLVSTT